MSDANHQIKRDAQLDADTKALADVGVDDTDVDDALDLLRRVRRERDAWPLDDANLASTKKEEAPPGVGGDLLWGDSGQAPKSLGRFTIKRELGRGGFGIVLQAYDPKLQCDVALKIPRAESLVSEEARLRMARESRAATILAHPNIVPLYEVGEFGAVTYLSYELCDGDTLADWLVAHRRQITPRLAAQIVARLSEALQHAHSRNIVHRDLKPSNILLEQTDEANENSENSPKALAERLRIADFGLAKLDAMRSDASRSGVPLGTPAYMSPEQARGEVTVGPASDVFSLGIILYELLTADVPFRRESDVATLRAIEGEPHATIIATAAPKDLIAICDKCLHKRATDRYPTAQMLQDDLERFLRDEPVTARPVSMVTRAARWCNRNRAVAGSLAALVTVLITATTISSMMWQREQSARGLAQRNEQRASISAGEARQQADALQNILADLLSDLTRVPSEDVQSLTPLLNRLLASYHEQIQRQDSQDPAIQENHLTTLEQLASIHRNLGDNRRAAELFEEAREYCQRRRPQELGRQAYFLGLMSGELRALGEMDRAIELARESVDIQRRAVAGGIGPRCSRQLLIAYLANLCEIIDDDHPSEANQFIDEAIELATVRIGKPPTDWPPQRFWNALLNDKTKVCSLLGELENTQYFAEIGLRNVEELLPNDRSYSLNQLAAIHQSLGRVHSTHEQHDIAEEHYRKAIEYAEELGKRHPQLGIVQSIVPPIVNAYAKALVASGKVDDARRLAVENVKRIEEYRQRFPQLEAIWNAAAEEANSLVEND